MRIIISKCIRKLANSTFWQNKIKEKFGILCAPKEPGDTLDPIILRQTYLILSKVPVDLVRDCMVEKLYFGFLGENKSYYPNHGSYLDTDKSITLNNDIFYHPDYPDDFCDKNGYRVSRQEETIWHEMLHGYDNAHKGLSLKQDWLKLSGWSPVPKPGLKRMVINEPGMPPKIGEWYYDPSAGFSRFYARMNPWDDWADSGCYYLSGLDKLPDSKKAYFNKLLKKYFIE